MLGFRYTENFRLPYVSRSITEFWRRWHISLSAWLRDYLYVPLGGNRRGRLRTYVNLLITMVLGGLWHGANWTFFIWGAWHGALLALERLAGVRAGATVYPRALALPMTLTLVIVGWVTFRAPDIATALDMYAGMVGVNGLWLSDNLAWQIGRADLVVLALAWAIVFAEPALSRIEWERAAPVLQGFGLTTLATLAVLKVSAATFSPFLYFQF
jgi:alginate O-acetyltransferase complex protein AlgI